MTLYFSFPDGWGTYELNGLDEKELVATGAHGYSTEQEAIQHVNASPSLPQQILLQSFKAESETLIGAGEAGDLSAPGGLGGLSGAVGSIFGKQNVSNWFLRIGEGLAGLLLIYAGAKQAFPQTIQVAGNTARKVVR